MTTCGGTSSAPEPGADASAVFSRMAETCDDSYNTVVQYAKRFGQSEYTGALCGYMDFLLPLLLALKELSFLPSAAIYLLVDDADYLNWPQTMALNSWISTRTQGEVSIKISSQLRYKTRATISRLPIQSPHDFREINISDIYTTRQGRYFRRVEQIVSRRLQTAGITKTPHEFFPGDKAQEQAIQKIGEDIRRRWPRSGRGHRAEDDMLRYARPEFIRALGGPSKSLSTYSYSGFEQLVHISSGLVRFFLDPAALMYDEQQSLHPGKGVTFVEPGVQNRMCRELADRLMMSEFEAMRKEAEFDQPGEGIGDGRIAGVREMHREMARLDNLIRALGGIFYLKLVSEDAERRVFSVAVSGKLDPDVGEVFELGVRQGYFHRSSIGNKDGTGRTRLYVLTRRLAPYFKLDPSSFAGYLWVGNDLLRSSMTDPEALLGRVKRDGVGKHFAGSQLTLFGDAEVG